MVHPQNSDQRPLSFGPGPAHLPTEVIQRLSQALIECPADDFCQSVDGEEIDAEFFDTDSKGLSILEISHRSKSFGKLLQECKKRLTSLLQLPSSHKIVFMQGGASSVFSAIPLNFAKCRACMRNEECEASPLLSNCSGAYVVTGTWSEKGYEEAVKLSLNTKIAASSKNCNYTEIPPIDASKWSVDAAKDSYFYFCSNETIHGVEFSDSHLEDVLKLVPESVPLICDASSNIISKPIANIERYACIFAGSQKNLGPAGVTLVIFNEEYVRRNTCRTHRPIPSMLDMLMMLDHDSVYNTPPTFALFGVAYMLRHLTQVHGAAADSAKGPSNLLEAIGRHNARKSAAIYDVVDASGGFYHAPAQKASRSRMNVVLRICDKDAAPSPALEARFLAEAAREAGLVQLAGHRSVGGGIRICLYSGLQMDEVQRLVDFMRLFCTANASVA